LVFETPQHHTTEEKKETSILNIETPTIKNLKNGPKKFLS
jgi:hypothetical protein